jgi:hypothetical protein
VGTALVVDTPAARVTAEANVDLTASRLRSRCTKGDQVAEIILTLVDVDLTGPVAALASAAHPLRQPICVVEDPGVNRSLPVTEVVVADLAFLVISHIAVVLCGGMHREHRCKQHGDADVETSGGTQSPRQRDHGRLARAASTSDRQRGQHAGGELGGRDWRSERQ